MVAVISWVYSAFNRVNNIVLFSYYLHKYVNVAEFLKDLLDNRHKKNN